MVTGTIMKNIPFDSVKNFLRDRTMVTLSAVLLLSGVVYAIYVGIALEPSDLQVATRYTAFSDTHFYRSKWYYLLSFILFAFVMISLHVALAIKLHARDQRQFAAALLALTLFLFVIAWILTRSVLQIAFL